MLCIVLFFAIGLLKPIVAYTYDGNVEEVMLDVAYEFLSEVAGLDIGENDVAKTEFMDIPDIVNHYWNCKRIDLYLTDDSRVVFLIRLGEDEPNLEDVVGYNLMTTSIETTADAETSVQTFLSKLVYNSVRYKSVYQGAMDIVEEVGVADGTQALFDDMLYTVSCDDDTFVLKWSKVVEEYRLLMNVIG